MDFQVKRDDIHRCRVVDLPAPELEPGQALLEVSSFGLTSNNITYASFGDALSYWSFFPAEEGWGRIPMWGFGDVAATRNDQLEEGTRVFGYLPPSEHLVVTPDRFGERGFVDAAPHRSSLPAAYNSYARVDADPAYDSGREDQQMLLMPLFFTSFLIDDMLDEKGFFGASAIVLSSASSKTAHGTAFLLHNRGGREVIGLTSATRARFVEGLGVYDRVVPYDEIGSLSPQTAVYVDFAGNPEVRSAVHHAYGDALAHSLAVGGTHWDQVSMAPPAALPGPEPTFFFAPSRIVERTSQWGREGLEARLSEQWGPYVEWTDRWLNIVHGKGPEAIENAYLEVLDGRNDPATAHVLSPS
jgi:hypothetical protein